MNSFQDTRYKTYTNAAHIISKHIRDKRGISNTYFTIQKFVLLNVKKTWNFISDTVTERKYSKVATVLIFSLSLSSMEKCNGPLKPGT
jgi:hypothetical protein